VRTPIRNLRTRARRRPPGRAVALGAALAVVALHLLPAPGLGQFLTFGKNKVQYNQFDWRVLGSRHFRVYYYPEEEELARIALTMSEEGYDRLRRLFVDEAEEPIPLIIYSSHQDFEQTNVTPSMMPEGVAGLTEFGRGRVLIPFGGSLDEFRTTIHHELVHVFQLSIERKLFSRRGRSSLPSPPLWFVEGLAVHASEGRDTEADMVMRDMVLSGRLPAIGEFWRYDGTFTLYKLGQSVLDFIGENYGEDRIRVIYDSVINAGSFEGAIEQALGITIGELSDRWAYETRRRYYPDIEQLEPVAFNSRELTRGPVDLGPTPVPAGIEGWKDRFLFLSPRTGYTNIYSASLDGLERDVRTVVHGERQGRFESLHPFRARMDINRKGELLFVSQWGGEDVIYVFSLTTRKIVEDHRFEDLVGLRSPSWSSDGRRFVFSGLSRAGEADIYLFDRDTGMLDRLTYDRYEDVDPSWEPGGERVVFASDRGPGEGRSRNLFLFDVRDRSLRYLTRGLWRDTNPSWSPDGKEVYFTTDRQGTFQIWRVNPAGRGGPVIAGLEGLTNARVAPDGRTLLFASFKDGQFRILEATVPPPPDTLSPPLAGLDPRELPPWRLKPPAKSFPVHHDRYHSKLSLEIAQGAVALDPNFRGGQGVQVLLADMMGNHLLFFQLGNMTFTSNNFLRNFSAGVSYMNLSRRLNYGVSFFHFVGDYLDQNGYPYSDRRAGGSTILIYPLSKFQRFELVNGLAYAETERFSNGFKREGPVAQHSIAWIRDTSLWLPMGPIDGQRTNLTLGATMDLQRGKMESSILIADYRRYVRLGTYSAYCVRAQALHSNGPNPQEFFLGGSLTLRGYHHDAFQGERSLLFNQEVRFPLVQRWMLQVPLGALEFPMIQGAVFLDAGSAWDSGWDPRWAGSFGGGLRMGMGGYLVLRLDVSRLTNFERVSNFNHWQFDIGWNY
jgi:hypothetical protein